MSLQLSTESGEPSEPERAAGVQVSDPAGLNMEVFVIQMNCFLSENELPSSQRAMKDSTRPQSLVELFQRTLGQAFKRTL